MGTYIKLLKDIKLSDLNSVGGKNASLGEMISGLSRTGVKVPEGFAITVDAYWELLKENSIEQKLSTLLSELDRKSYTNLHEISSKAKALIIDSNFPVEVAREIIESYKYLSGKKVLASVAVRSSATAEDLPGASFAGQHDSYLNVEGVDELIIAVKKCFASLYNERAIKYREDNGFGHNFPLSVGVQRMIRSDLACSGVAFTLEPESGNENIVLITGVWGLGENIVQGTVSPDEFYVFKPSLKSGKKSIISKKTGEKALTMTYDHNRANTEINIDTPLEKREKFVLKNDEVIKLAGWTMAIEVHYQKHMDIEWAKDGIENEIYIVQARPETVHSSAKNKTITEYNLKEKGKVLATGVAVGEKIVTGIARKLKSPDDIDSVKDGDILVTDITSPDWDPVLKKVSAIITNKGGRTSHAAIVARELGAAAIVGTGTATNIINDGDVITVSCAEGKIGFVYQGVVSFEKTEIDPGVIEMPFTKAMIIISDPEKAYKLSMYPNDGVGLLRLEFAINNEIKIHPMALVKYDLVTDSEARKEIDKLTHLYSDKRAYFVDKLS